MLLRAMPLSGVTPSPSTLPLLRALRAPAAPPRPPHKPPPLSPRPAPGPSPALRFPARALKHRPSPPASLRLGSAAASQRNHRRLLAVVYGSGAPPASCGLWRALIGPCGSAPPRLGRGRCRAGRGLAPPSPWAPVTTSTTICSKVRAQPVHGRRTAPGSAGTSEPRGPGASAAALVRGAALWAPGLVWC